MSTPLTINSVETLQEALPIIRASQEAYECFLLGKHTVERVCSGLSPLRRDRLWC